MFIRVAQVASIFVIFNIYVYYVHSSISSMGNIDFFTGKYRRLAEEKQMRYRRALQDSKSEWENSRNVTIQKCCGRYHSFNKNLECVPTNTTEHFFPLEMIVYQDFGRENSNISIKIEVFDVEDPCRDQLILLEDKDMLKKFIITETGELFQRENFEIVLNFSRHYCLDAVHSRHERYFILMLCPCKENLCIQKCCPFGEYYNTVSSKCTNIVPSGKNLELDFYHQENRLNYSIKHFLVNRPLNCNDEPDELINNLDDQRDVLVQEDGRLLRNVKNGGTFVDLIGYCVDLFSDGKGNKRINGFYCKDTMNKRSATGSYSSLSKCCELGKSLDEKYSCEENQKNTTLWKPTPKFMGSNFSLLEYNGFDLPEGFLSMKLRKDEFLEKSIDRERKKLYVKDILKTYNSSVFCVDTLQGNTSDFAVYFAPCKDSLCLQKCCPYGHYYNTQTLDCVEDTKISNQNIQVSTFQGFGEVHRSADYYLIYDKSKCPYFKRQLFLSTIGLSKLLIQENGNIIKQKEQYKIYVWITPLRYCVDIFSNGTIGLVNGFYCTDDPERQGRMIGTGQDPTSNTAVKTLCIKSFVFLSILELMFI